MKSLHHQICCYILCSKNGICSEIQTSPGVTNCNSFVWFWISWINGIISLGKGLQIGQNVITMYSDAGTKNVITNIGISSPSATAASNWIFPGCFYAPGKYFDFIYFNAGTCHWICLWSAFGEHYLYEHEQP